MKYVEGMGCVWDNPLHNEIEDLRRTITRLQTENAKFQDSSLNLQQDLVDSLQQIEKLTKERDTYKAMLDFQNMRAERMMEGNGK